MTDLIARFIGLFTRQHRLLSEASSQPDTMMTYLNAVRARAFLKITGRNILSPSLRSDHNVDSLSDNMSPVRRLARRND